MYFSNDCKKTSSRIRSYNRDIIRNLIKLHFSALNNTRSELDYFRQFFPSLQSYFNGMQIPGITFNCRTKEIHATPLVNYGPHKTCELGDYFIVVKYKINGIIIGRKIIIYQLKRTHSRSWTIDQKQLNLLKDWPTFSFGRRLKKLNSYTVRPTQPEYGSFVLIGNKHYSLMESNLFGTAYEIFNNQNGGKVRISDSPKFCSCGVFSCFKLLTWEIGEPIIPNTDIDDFCAALYRYMDWIEDPPDEFIKFEKKGEKHGFWGIEIIVNSEYLSD